MSLPSPPRSTLHNLDVLAHAALADDDIEMSYSQPNENPHFSCDSSSDTSSNPSDSPPQSFRRLSRPSRSYSPYSLANSERSSRPTVRSARSSRSTQSSKAAEDKTKRRARMKRTIERASRIKSVSNSPANQFQQAVLLTVYNNITQFPSEYWQAIIGVNINRTLAQVRNWFSNMRQKKRSPDDSESDDSGSESGPEPYVTSATAEGDSIKFRPCALTICPEWSDDIFEGVVGLARLSSVALKDA